MRTEQLDAAIRRQDEDVRQRLLIFDGGPQLMAWENAHRLHADEPYIGCPFCHDEFVPLAALQEAERERDRLRASLRTIEEFAANPTRPLAEACEEISKVATAALSSVPVGGREGQTDE